MNWRRRKQNPARVTMEWSTEDTIYVGSEVTGLSETPNGDLQIDMADHETLILTPAELEIWLRHKRELDALPTA